MKYKPDDATEQEMELVYHIKIKTTGKPSKHIDAIGDTLANLCGLNFTDAEVKRGKKTYTRKTNHEE